MKSKFMQIAGEELRERGYKLTEPRLAILDYLVKHNGHPVIQEIYEGIKRKYPELGWPLFTARWICLRPSVWSGC